MADVFNMTDTWNAGGTTFTAIKMNVTDTASAAASLLLDMQVGGASKLSVSKGGSLVLTGGTITAAAPIFDATRTWNNAGVTFTAMRLNVTDTASGGSSLLMDLQVGGSSVFSVHKSGGITLASSAAVVFTNRVGIVASAFGVMVIRDSAGTSFERLCFGGTTSSFPAMKRSTTLLQARLADDSDFAPLQGRLRSHANATAETPSATHTLRIFDAAGTEYKVLAVAA